MVHVKKKNLKKKEVNSDTCYIVDETWGHYAKWIKPVEKG